MNVVDEYIKKVTKGYNKKISRNLEKWQLIIKKFFMIIFFFYCGVFIL